MGQPHPEPTVSAGDASRSLQAPGKDEWRGEQSRCLRTRPERLPPFLTVPFIETRGRGSHTRDPEWYLAD